MCVCCCILQQFVIGPHKLLHIKTSFTHAELKLRLLLMSIWLAAGFTAAQPAPVAPTTRTQSRLTLRSDSNPTRIQGNPSWGEAAQSLAETQRQVAALTAWLTGWLTGWRTDCQMFFGRAQLDSVEANPRRPQTLAAFRRHLLPPILQQLIVKLWYDLGQPIVQHHLWMPQQTVRQVRSTQVAPNRHA